eukprot:c8024_g1_i2.p1 GENE.c8024_g1_i2~~c8024_g1_i2.p1  ORF type:complete len:242 (+),score=87.58 c8024_g1_i2:281-1006(+)
MSFSEMVSQTCACLYDLIEIMFEDCEEGGSIAMIPKYVDQLMIEGVNKTIADTIDQSVGATVYQSLQFSFDCTAFVNFSNFLEKRFALKAKLLASTNLDLRLNCRTALDETSKRAWDTAFSLISIKVLDLSRSSTTNWEPNTMPDMPSDNIALAISFGESFLMGVSIVQQMKTSQLTSFFAQKLTEITKASILSAKKVNVYGLLQLNQDIASIESFASRYRLQQVPVISQMRQVRKIIIKI